ncbi:ABC transporter ATP-binding protein [Frigoribacterium faeni]|uniref:dipeptide ABC transporter ATP-binding protein n=1 Tax=Frigoribacterium TaxID=96492 RepID=UPI001FADE203|nr:MULTISPECIES: ABC transporter ATP-binding protein [Frigoribacterium]MCJ0701910.1 ABC transporter ATP-binding protein [Frigoribacterium faeni]MDY0890473.1 ABC transporter ATP-binding protein [Frigoribacterium sp. CFBP9030]
MPQDADRTVSTTTTDASAGAPLLSVRDLQVSFGDRPVVHGVDLDVARGERVAIVGQSGSGKSTVVAAVLRLLPGAGRITGGTIRLGDDELTTAGEARMRSVRGARIGLVPQDPSTNLNPSMTVGAQIADGLRAGGARGRAAVADRVVELMTEAGIPDAARRSGQYPHEFSGGMRQRVLIAVALARRPELLIADEPTSALDVTVQRTILDHLQTLVDAHGTSLLFITHDLGVAADRTDRIVVMLEGRVVETGTPRQILLDPQHEYTKRLVAAAPTVAAAAALRADEPIGDDAPTAADDILTVTDLVKEYRLRGRRGETVRAVDGISFAVPRGTTTAVVGESGSGKTTLARMVLGIEPATSGTALVDGESITASRGAARRALRRRVQPVFQDPYGSLDPTYPVERLIDEPLRIFGVGDRSTRRRRVAELLDQVALPRSVAQSRPNELSGGQRQRVAIARALALEPELLICDEAVSALDVLVQEQILDLLADLQTRLGLSYLFITHDLAVVRQIAHSVVVMRRGGIVERGSVDDVFLSPRDEYTHELLGAIPGASLAV